MGRGFHLDDDEPVERLFDTVLAHLAPGDLLALNGSLPAGLPDTTWAELVRRADPVPVLLDLQETALDLALAVRAPMAVVPNLAEARAVLGEPALSPVQALAKLSDRGVRFPVVTLGEAGALVGIDRQPYLVAVHVPEPAVLVGAGDAFAAGLASVLVDRPEDRLAAVVWATAVAGAHVAGSVGEHLEPAATELAHHVTITPWHSA